MPTIQDLIAALQRRNAGFAPAVGISGTYPSGGQFGNPLPINFGGGPGAIDTGSGTLTPVGTGSPNRGVPFSQGPTDPWGGTGMTTGGGGGPTVGVGQWPSTPGDPNTPPTAPLPAGHHWANVGQRWMAVPNAPRQLHRQPVLQQQAAPDITSIVANIAQQLQRQARARSAPTAARPTHSTGK